MCKDAPVQDSRVEVSCRGLGYICTEVSDEPAFSSSGCELSTFPQHRGAAPYSEWLGVK